MLRQIKRGFANCTQQLCGLRRQRPIAYLVNIQMKRELKPEELSDHADFVTTIAPIARGVSDRFGHRNCVILRDLGNEPLTSVSSFRAFYRRGLTLNAQNCEIAQLGSTPVRAANELEGRRLGELLLPDVAQTLQRSGEHNEPIEAQ